MRQARPRLCVDEFHVHDIGDARLIARMLDALFQQRITLVVTSNYPPDDLMPNPLFHDAFLPTIALLNKHLHVVSVDGPVDYRTRKSTGSRFSAGTWSTGSRAAKSRAGKSPAPASNICVTFEELCCTPKSTGDYLMLADRVERLTITDVPGMRDMTAYAAQRFANLVDILYDRNVRTDFHARVPIHRFDDSCTGLDVDRIVSRLRELDLPETR